MRRAAQLVRTLLLYLCDTLMACLVVHVCGTLPAAAPLLTDSSAICPAGVDPITYADLEVMGLKVATRLAWLDVKVKKSTIQSGGETIADQFGAAWDVSLGRRDAVAADPEGRLPQPGASTKEIRVRADAQIPCVPQQCFTAG